MNKSDQKLFYAVFEILINLPAYEPEEKYREIVKRHTYINSDKLLRNINLVHITKKAKISLISKKINLWRKIWFSFKLSPKMYKDIYLTTIITFALVWLVKIDIYWFKLLGILFFFIFAYLFVICIILFVDEYNKIDHVFSTINKTANKIKKYIIYFREINGLDWKGKINIISQSIIKDDISSLDYQWKKIDLFSILFAFYIVIAVVYILGDSSIDGIKWIANLLNFGNFEFIQKLTLETLALSIFPIAIAMSKFFYVSGLQQRNENLRYSLVIVENRFQELNSSSTQSFIEQNQPSVKSIPPSTEDRIFDDMKNFRQSLFTKGEFLSQTIINARKEERY